MSSFTKNDPGGGRYVLEGIRRVPGKGRKFSILGYSSVKIKFL